MAAAQTKGARFTSKKSVYLLFAIGFAIAILAGALFINRMASIVHEQTVSDMKKIAQQDIDFVESTLKRRIASIKHAGESIQMFGADSVSEAQRILRLHSDEGEFQYMYLVDDRGNLYFQDGEVIPSYENPLLQYSKPSEMPFIRSLSYAPFPDQPRKRYLAYGAAIEPFTVEGVTFIGAIGTNETTIMQQTMKLASFDDQGISSIINSYGYNLVSVENDEAQTKNTNFFADLSKGHTQDYTVDEIRQTITNGEGILFNWTDDEGIELITLVRPLSVNSWSLVLSEPVSSLSDKSMQLVMMTAELLAVVIFVSLVLFFVYLRSSRKRTAEAARTQARSEFLSSLSHEIRTPITGMVGLIDLMKKHIGDRGQMEKLVGQAETSTNYLLSLVNDILDMSRLEAGKTDFVLASVNVDEMIMDACMMQRETYRQRGVGLQADVSIEHPWVMTDPLHAKQVIMNILGNASKFTPQGGLVKLTAYQAKSWDAEFLAPEDDAKGGSVVAEGRNHIDANGQPNGILTIIKIEDNGIGMTPDFLNTIFDPFAQERTRSNAEQKGTGLGMAISHDLAIALGGTIQVDSQLGEGSCFTIVLPAQITEPPSEDGNGVSSPETGDGSRASLPDMSILFADDNDLNSEIILDIMREEGVGNIVRAANGQEVIDLLTASEPGAYDLILSDINMPVMNGYEAASAIRSLDRPDASTIFILACSANTVEEDGDRASNAGMNGFLEKPVQPDQVVAAYNALLQDPERFYTHKPA